MSDKPLRYKLADVGLYVGGAASLIYAFATADGEGANYISELAKQFVSEPIIPATIGGMYCIGGLIDSIRPNK